MDELRTRLLARRTFLRGAALGGVGLATAVVIGCGDDDDDDAAAPAAAPAAATPAAALPTAAPTPTASTAAATPTPTAAPTETPPGAPLSPFEEQVVDGITGGDEGIIAFTEEPDTLPVARVVKQAAVDAATGERVGERP